MQVPISPTSNSSTKVRFAHLADCHVGSYREPKLKELNILAFSNAIDKILAETKKDKIDFVIIAGDLFNNALPSIDVLKLVTEKLKLLHDNHIPVYGVGGSHDYSAAGKSMLEVLDKAHIFKNVMTGSVSEQNKLQLEFTEDKKSGVILTGIVGKRGTLEKSFYDAIDYEYLSKSSDLNSSNTNKQIKIFLFHSAISEYKPSELSESDSIPLSLLPKNFSYYAGGHVHYRYIQKEFEYGTIAFPGPIFPNNFKELEELKNGSFIIAEINKATGEVTTNYHYLENKIEEISLSFTKESPQEVYSKLKSEIINKDLAGALLLVRLKGTLSSGNLSQINFNELTEIALTKGALCFLRNTAQLTSEEFNEISLAGSDVNSIETNILNEHISQSNLKNVDAKNLDQDLQKKLVLSLISGLNTEKKDGEKSYDFEERVYQEFQNIIKDKDFSSN